jgi:hypothetical protein
MGPERERGPGGGGRKLQMFVFLSFVIGKAGGGAEGSERGRERRGEIKTKE